MLRDTNVFSYNLRNFSRLKLTDNLNLLHILSSHFLIAESPKVSQVTGVLRLVQILLALFGFLGISVRTIAGA